MSRITGVIVALATTTAVLTTSSPASTAGGAAPGAAELPREIRGGVELALADGDLLRVWATDDHRAVLSRRWDAATGAWGTRLDVVRRKNLFCGEVEGRTANGAVALLAQCDRGGYADDQAPTSSQALWSPDTVTWSSYELAGEAYEEPGISPDGQNAVWPQHQRYTTRTASGFAEHTLDADGQEYTVTATITDTAQVSFLYGTCSGSRARLVVQTRTGDAAPTRQEVRAPRACSDVGLANVDSDTVWLGDLDAPAHRAVVSRADASSPWALTAIAPADAPGLELIGGYRMYTEYFVADGIPLIALGSRTGGKVRAQLFDPTSQTWGVPRVVHDTGGRHCSWGDARTEEQLAVIAIDLRCDRDRHLVLTTRDGVSWQALPMGRHTYGLSLDGRYVAVPGPRRTYVISPERGVVSLPYGVSGRCEVVVPDGPGAAVLLTAAGRHKGWPTVLQHSGPDGWTRLARTDLPTHDTPCVAAQPSVYDLPYRFNVFGRMGRGYTVQVLQRGGEWTVRRSWH